VASVRPLRWLVMFDLLEGQNEPVVEVERRPAVVHRPPRVRLIQHTAEKRLVEPGQFEDIGAIQDDTLQSGSHEA
jgi:hypothetical protein